ncbi:MAG: YfiM family protein, partial [Bacteroidia bacterium]|nr:YfiM family protein [Bacteroidia bacterium]
LLICVNIIDAKNQVLLPSDTIDFDKRKQILTLGTIGLYSAASTGLYFAWYKQYDQEAFHFFNDWGEWNNMDKAGHSYATYTQALLLHKGAQWAGYENQKALNMSVLGALIFQNTFEIMDGFSRGWGFSLGDFTANIFGASSFYFQQKYWGEQKVKFKFSYAPVEYSSELLSSESGLFSTSPKARAEALYGKNPLERLLKDYNGQTYWLSFDIRSIIDKEIWPSWMNLAIGYGSENIYGANNNSWEINDERTVISEAKYPRYKKFVLALDYNLGKIRTKNKFSRTILDLLDVLKWPAPAIEYRTNNTWHFSLLFLH